MNEGSCLNTFELLKPGKRIHILPNPKRPSLIVKLRTLQPNLKLDRIGLGLISCPMKTARR